MIAMEDFKLCAIIGAMKSGTTGLFYQLAEHPAVCRSQPKEPSFFTRDTIDQAALHEYRGLFQGIVAGQWACEASTEYTKHPRFPGLAGRLYDAFPDSRLIYLARDPVDRIYSEYLHNVANGRERRRFAEAALAGDYLALSSYATQVEQYLHHFPRNQLLLLVFEEYVASPLVVLNRVYDFLGIDRGFVPRNLNEVHNASSAKTRDGWLQRLLGRVPGYGLVSWRVREPVRRLLQRQLPARADLVDARLEAALWEVLEDQVAAFEQYLGRPIPPWRRPLERSEIQTQQRTQASHP